MDLPARVPGIVRGYDPDTRLCKVEIPGITDGSPELPDAEIEYPIGDKSANSAHNTEIEILAGDLIWLAFENGDARYPIITGYRNPRSGNPSGARRWHHANIELNADTQVHVIAGDNMVIDTKTLTINASTQVIVNTPITKFSGQGIFQGLLSFLSGMFGSGTGGGSSNTSDIDGDVGFTGALKNNGVNVGSTHKHMENGAGNLTNDPQ
ncbi:hypothetical protein [Paraburkholderia domus]|uniref:hypothetical protein n=1 Tax=Paraburkholderia domus TaxID=2793075 RepID=UPI001911A8F2|nr:hypothetical protein [Paraburkholderia domus]MBK5061822.1 hypothetical protein [Burkholderia sp. R-70199]CAE6901169.1 hypothetical protein R70199_03702 [Paraburkholderia domus]